MVVAMSCMVLDLEYTSHLSSTIAYPTVNDIHEVIMMFVLSLGVTQ